MPDHRSVARSIIRVGELRFLDSTCPNLAESGFLPRLFHLPFCRRTGRLWFKRMGFKDNTSTKFYRLREPKPDSEEDRRGRIDAMPEEGFRVGAAPTCPRCGRFLGMLSWLPPYRLEIETWGKHYGDVARTGDDLIVSERFQTAYTKSGLKGLVSFEPVEVIKVVHRRKKPQEPLPRYFKATVVRSPTTIDQQASGFVWQDESKVCPECLFDTLLRFARLVVQEETWNGDDIFFPRGGSGPIATEAFRTFFQEHGFTGASFIPAEEDQTH